MSGKPINQHQVNLYLVYRKTEKQKVAASKAGISERTARRIDKGECQVNKPPREYRTRLDPLDGVILNTVRIL